MVRLAKDSDIERIVDLHFRVLHWSINGRLGRDHVDRLYRALFRGDDFFVVLMEDPKTGDLLGFASASTNAAAARSRIRRIVSWSGRLRLLAHALSRPKELFDLLETAFVIPILIAMQGTPAEILTWVTQPKTPAGAMAAHRCFTGVLAHFSVLGHSYCVAQVLRSNRSPNRFHEARGTPKAFMLLINNIYIIKCEGQS